MGVLGWIGGLVRAVAGGLIAAGGALPLLVIYDALSRRGESHGNRRATT